MRAHVLTTVLPSVLRHLPAGADWPDGVLVTADALTLPLVRERVVVDGTAWPGVHYVAYAGGEPAVYHSPNAFRALVRKGTAWFVAKRVEGTGAGPSVDLTRDRGRGAWSITSPRAEVAP